MNKERKKSFLVTSLLVIALILVFVTGFAGYELIKYNGLTPVERVRLSYDEITEEDMDTYDGYSFGAYFLSDIDGDGELDKVTGSCNKIGEEDTLYIYIKADEGTILSNAVIELDARNMHFSTNLIENEYIQGVYIGENTTEIELKEITGEVVIELPGKVRSGDYSSEATKRSALRNNYTRYSGTTYLTLLADASTEWDTFYIEKTVDVKIDWYGDVEAVINNTEQAYSNANIINVNKDTVELQFEIDVQEKYQQLFIKDHYVTGIIPELNGYQPTYVEIIGEEIISNYNEDTREFNIQKSEVYDDNGYLMGYISGQNRYQIYVEYPLEAYNYEEEPILNIEIPIQTYYECYNNTDSAFKNPLASDVAEDVIHVVYGDVENNLENIEVDTTIGENLVAPYSNYVISKDRYSEIKDVEYNKAWEINTSKDNDTKKVIITEELDSFIDVNNTKHEVSGSSIYTGMYFVNAFHTVKSSIKVFDDNTNELIHEFTADDWSKYSKDNLFEISGNVSKIRIEIDGLKAANKLYINFAKRLLGNGLKGINQETYNKLNQIRSYINVNVTNVDNTTTTITEESFAKFDNVKSIAVISKLSKTDFSVQNRLNNVEIVLSTIEQRYNTSKWINGEFLLEFPIEIYDVEINSVTINKENVKVKDYEKYKENGKVYVKINTQNILPEIFEISVKSNIVVNSDVTIGAKDLNLYYYNNLENSYLDTASSEDIYDVNANNDLAEIVGKYTGKINIVKPNALNTYEIATEYNDNNDTEVSPRIAKLDNKTDRTAKISLYISNENSNSVKDIIIVGKIPFEGNKSHISAKDLGSSYSTTMKSEIEVPAELKQYTKVYYSEKENVTNSTENTSNDWNENITDLSKVKSFLIKIENFEMLAGSNYQFGYIVNIPDEVEYNDIAYSTHSVFYNLVENDGTLVKKQIESSKLGFGLEKSYSVSIDTEKLGFTAKVPGIVYSIKEKGTNNGVSATTNANGNIVVNDLIINKPYVITIVKSTDNYSSVGVEVEFKVVEKNDSLELEILSGENRIKSSSVTDNTVNMVIGVEAKNDLTINVSDDYGKMEGATFRVKGENLDQTVTTDVNGTVNIKGLELGIEYEIQQIDGVGHTYDDSVYTLSVQRDELGIYITTTGTFEYYINENSENENNIIINVINDRISTYQLRVNKKVVGTNTPITENVYNLSGKWLPDEGIKLEVNQDGYFIATKLYEGVEYTLTEYSVDDSYSLNETPIIFTADRNNVGVLEVDSTDSNYTISGTTVTFDLQNNKKIKIYTKDLDDGTLIPNAKYSIKGIELSADGIVEVDAKNNDGNLVGKLELINSENIRTLVSDSTGAIKEDFAPGLYKLIKIEVPAGYVLENDIASRTVYFGVGMSIEDVRRILRDSKSNLDNNNGLKYVKTIQDSDGSQLAIAEFSSDIVIPAEKTVNGEEISISLSEQAIFTTNMIVIKTNADNKVEWAKEIISNSGNQTPKDICETTNGYIVIGTTTGTTVKAGEMNLTNSAEESGFIFKIDDDGTVSNGYIVESTENSVFNDVISINGSIYLTGNFMGNTVIDATDTTGEEINIVADTMAALVAKLDSNGKFEWIKLIDSTANDNALNIEGLGNGNVLVTINTNATTITIPAELMENNTETTISNINSNLKLEINPNGKVVTGTNLPLMSNIKTINLADGYILIGEYTDRIRFNADTTADGQEIAFESNGQTDIVYVKYNSNGKVEWAKSLGGNFEEKVYQIKQDKDGNYIILGNSNSVELNISSENTVNNHQMRATTQGYRSAVIFKITSEGKALWLTTITEPNDLYLKDFAINENGTYTFVGISNNNEARYIYRENVTLEAISKVEEVDVMVNKQIYTISTNESTGGKIVDQNGNEFTLEELYYGQDSAYELSIIPDAGYELLKLTINGEDVDFIVEDDGSIKLPKYTNITNSVYIEKTFATNIGNVIVHHYKSGTTEKVAPDENLRGSIGDKYSVYPRKDIADYIVDQNQLPTNTTGVFSDTDQIVEFYYEERMKTVIVHHYLEGTNAMLAADDGGYYNIGDEYTTSPAQLDAKYEIAYVVGDTEGTVTDNLEIFYYYRVKTFNITTEILTGKGDVSGEEYTIYEKVKYGEESVKDITISADDGYGIQRVVVEYIDGNNIVSQDITDTLDLTQETITLDQFANVTTNINVKVDFDRKEISIIVHYYEENSTVKVSEDFVIKGFIGDEYETFASQDVNLDKYELIETPVRAIGTFETDGEELIYYYRIKEYTVKGVENENGTIKVGDKDSESVKYGEDTVGEVVITPKYGYKVVNVKVNGVEQEFTADETEKVNLGKITDVIDDVVIEAEYAKIEAQVIVNYYETGSKNAISASKTIDGYISEEYTVEIPTDINTVKYTVDTIVIEPATSTFDQTTLKGVFVEKTATINVYFKIAEYKISANVSEGGTITDVEEIVKYGENSTKDIIITPNYGYKVTKITVNGVEVEFTAKADKTVELEKFTNVLENKVIDVTFEKLGSIVTVEYVDKDGNELKEPLTIKGKVGESYTTTRENIENYRAYGQEPANASGEFIETEIVVRYVYEKIPAEVLVEYVDKDGNVLETQTVNGFVGEDYTTTRKEFDGYRSYGENPANASGKFTETRITVTYVYEKIPAQVIVNYYENVTGSKIAEEVIIEGYVNEGYTTSEPAELNKNKYLFVEIVAESDGNLIYDETSQKGTFINETTYVNYYYDIATFNITAESGPNGEINDITETVRYGESSTKELIMDPYNGYKVSKVTVNGQEVEFTEDENRNARINKIENITEDILVKVEFERIPVIVKVNYYETNTTIPVIESKEITGYVFDRYTTEEATGLNPEKYTFSHIEATSNGDLEYDINTESGMFVDASVVVTYYYDVTTFGISGIAGTGGTISDIEEIVKYGENSTKDIIIKPNYGYKTTNVLVNNVPIEFTENADKTVTLEKFTDVRENKTIVIQFGRRATYTYINYYEENSTKKIAETYMQSGFVDEEYTAKEPDNLDISKYKLTGISVENEDAIFDKVTLKGRFVENDTYINYYYKVMKHQITVNCGYGGTVNKTTETVIHGDDSIQDFIIKPNIGYRITAIYVNNEPIEFTPDEAGRYMLEKFENVTENKVVTVEFEPVEALVVINYVDNHGNVIAEQEARGGFVGETFNIQRKDIPKYKAVRGDQNSYAGIFTEDPIVITFRYEKIKGTVKVEYVDPQGNYITTSDIIRDEIDTPYETSRKEIHGYKPYGEDPINTTGIIEEGTIYVRYMYERIPAHITVHYVKDTGEPMGESEVINGYVGQDYKIIRKGFVNYTGCGDDPNEYTGQFTEEPIEITFVYEKIKCKVYVRYVDKDGVDLLPSDLKTGEVAESYEIVRKDIPNYRAVEPEPTNKIGIFTEEPITVTFVYEKIPAKLIVHYIDSEGNTISESEMVNGYLGENYNVERKDISGYRAYGDEPLNKTGVYTEEPIEITFVYERIPTQVIVKYVDTEGNELLPTETIDGFVGDMYNTSRKNIEYYKKSGDNPSNAFGEFTEETITVTYVYEKIPAQVVVKHVDTEGNILVDDVVIDGKQGESYTTERKTIYGYRAHGEDPENKEGIIDSESIEVVYVYEKVEATVIVKHLDDKGNPIAEEEILEGFVTERYETQRKEIEGYETYGEDPENKAGEYKEEVIEVVYVYKIKELKVITQVVGPEGSGTITGGNEEFYEVVEYGKDATKDIKIAIKYGYRIVKVTVNDVEVQYTANEDGTYTIEAFKEVKEDKLVKVEIEKIKADVVVKYVDTEGKQLAEPVTIEGLLGEEYTTERKAIEYYRAHGEDPENANGVHTEGVIEVVYVYERIPSGIITVKYLEKDTNKELAEPVEISGYVGEMYEAEQKKIDNYKFVSVEETAGKLTEEDKEIIFYYEKLKFDLEIISYVDSVVVNSQHRTIGRDTLAKVEIDRENIKKNEILVKYKIVVKNSGEIAGFARTIIDYIPSGMLYLEADNMRTVWEKKGDMLINNDLNELLLQPGEMAELELVLRWDNGENSFGERVNQVIISDYINSLNDWKDINTSNNTSKTSFIIVVKTGHIDQLKVIQTVFDIVITIVLGAGILLRVYQFRKYRNY